MKLINLRVATESHTAGEQRGGEGGWRNWSFWDGSTLPKDSITFPGCQEVDGNEKTKVDVEDVNGSCETDLIKNLFSMSSSIYIDTLKEPFIVQVVC